MKEDKGRGQKTELVQEGLPCNNISKTRSEKDGQEDEREKTDCVQIGIGRTPGNARRYKARYLIESRIPCREVSKQDEKGRKQNRMIDVRTVFKKALVSSSKSSLAATWRSFAASSQ
jgi:hypothetical protein